MPSRKVLNASTYKKARITCRIIWAIEWAARRMGPQTASLHIEILSQQVLKRHPEAGDALAHILSQHGETKQLRCLEVNLLGSLTSTHNTARRFLTTWLLEHSPNLEALSMRKKDIEAVASSFHRLKHLEMAACDLPDITSETARQMPILETLFMQALNREGAVQTIDAAAFQHLRHLALSGINVEQLIRKPGCRFSMDLGVFCDSIQLPITDWSREMVSHMGSAEQVRLFSWHLSEWAAGVLERFPCMQTLKVSCPGPGTHCVFSRCMPANGERLWNLKTIIISGSSSIECCLPAALPTLEKLVILASERLDLSFESEAATFGTLKTLCAFGQPLLFCGYDIPAPASRPSTANPMLLRYPRLQTMLLERGLSMGAVWTYLGKRGKYKGDSGCLYLKPVSAPELLIEDLYSWAERALSCCWCGACFACLRAAGAMHW